MSKTSPAQGSSRKPPTSIESASEILSQGSSALTLARFAHTIYTYNLYEY